MGRLVLWSARFPLVRLRGLDRSVTRSGLPVVNIRLAHRGVCRRICPILVAYKTHRSLLYVYFSKSYNLLFSLSTRLVISQYATGRFWFFSSSSVSTRQVNSIHSTPFLHLPPRCSTLSSQSLLSPSAPTLAASAGSSASVTPTTTLGPSGLRTRRCLPPPAAAAPAAATALALPALLARAVLL